MDIIRNALQTICDLANSFLENLDPRGDDWIVLTSLVDHDGAINQPARDKIVMTVYNISREPTVSTYVPTTGGRSGTQAGDALAVISPPLYLDVHLMFMANFAEAHYADGLAALSRLIGYFQQTPYFTHDNARALSDDIDKLTMDFESLGPVEVNYVMGMLGTRYFPSAFYKLRMLPFVSTAMQGRGVGVSGAALSTTPAQRGAV